MVSTTFTYLSRLRRDNYVHVVDTIHVAGAVADTDETYGAYAAAENNTFNNANASINNANNRNKNANYSNNNSYNLYINSYTFLWRGVYGDGFLGSHGSHIK